MASLVHPVHLGDDSMNVTVLAVLVVLVAICMGFLALYLKDPEYIWEIERRYKWHRLKLEINNISSVHSRTSGKGKGVSLLERGQLKSSLIRSAGKYDAYIKFCEDKELALPTRDDEINDMIDQSLEVLDLQRALDRELDRATREYNRMRPLLEECGGELLSERLLCLEVLDDAQRVVDGIARHPKSFSTDIGRVNAQLQTFAETRQFAEAREGELKAAVGGAAAGVAAGAGVATLAPGALMWVATTFGTASTGAAISTLSGAVAQSASLAFLGGGAVAMGGGGVAAGEALLALAGPIGWGVAGATVVATLIFHNIKVRDAQKRQSEEIVRVKNGTEALKELRAAIEQLLSETRSLSKRLRGQVVSCERYRGRDYSSLTEDEQKELGALVNNAVSLSTLLNKTLGDQA